MIVQAKGNIMQGAKNYFIKTNRAFSGIRKYGWIFTVLVAIGGLW